MTFEQRKMDRFKLDARIQEAMVAFENLKLSPKELDILLREEARKELSNPLTDPTKMLKDPKKRAMLWQRVALNHIEKMEKEEMERQKSLTSQDTKTE